MDSVVNTVLRGELLLSHPLQRYTAWRVGGPAQQLYLPADKQDLSQYLSSLPSAEKTTWLGLGSNTLIRDGGIQGHVIVTQGNLKNIERVDETVVYAEAGVSCATLARYCARLGLTGIEFLAGIPGTVGGALAMNAGCFGGETWEHVKQVESIDSRGEFHRRSPCEYHVAYRSVKCVEKEHETEFFTAGYFQLKAGSKEQSLEKIRQLLEHRAKTQPTNEFSCGSTFRNPPGDYAGRLIEAVGLKGMRIGGAIISEKHANFIINDGTARATDIEALIEHIVSAVFAKSGIQLVREVHILGEM